ncbi:hypothetical protein ASE39_25470 [Acidovorax sp. Root267]|uniref:HlyD family secretion protein n=1 Tax=Acidovorax sp. Root267 TaxID=1736505 RepID=UPI00070C2F80|nr:HlyD family efflux transporter periplasmic adaptor subunit [Acidovorax sp. Root267]KRD19900.1 hypothetical protein ASE39_25470 [Acidovorax sp. Root267]
MNDLYRIEAIDQQRQRLVGNIVLRQAWPTKVLTAIFGGLFCSLILVFFLFGFARRETLSGVLLPAAGLIQISSPQPGLVEHAKFDEGQTVVPGDVLFTLSGERDGSGGSTRQRVGEILRRQREQLVEQIGIAQRQTELDRAALVRRSGWIDTQLAQLGFGIVRQRDRAELTGAAARRFESAEYAPVVSREKLDEKRADLIEQEVRLHTMQREHAALLVERDKLRAEIDKLPLQLQRDIGSLENSLNEIRRAEAENDTQRRWEVRAPRGGQLTVMAVKAGQTVSAGAALASIAPEGSALEAVLYAPSRAAGQIAIGTPTQVRFEALPYQKFGQFPGEVREVSRSPVPSHERALITSAEVSMYRVRVILGTDRLTPDLLATLKAGMQISATVTVEHRRFYEWVLGPLLGAKAQAI